MKKFMKPDSDKAKKTLKPKDEAPKFEKKVRSAKEVRSKLYGSKE